MPLRRALVALLAAAFTFGLTVGSAGATAVPTYTQRNSGSVVKVKQGTIFKVSLRTAADGGYAWSLTHGRHSRDFALVSRRVISPEGVVGGYAQTVFTLRATHAGTDYISAVERRSFERNSTIARFKLTITVGKR